MSRFLLILCLFLISGQLSALPKLGYGSSTAVVNSRIQEGFFMGFELGIESVLGADMASKILVLNQKEGASQLLAVQSANELIEKKVIGIFGYPGSHDSLLAAGVVKNKGVLTVFPGCNHNELANVGKTIFSTGHSMDQEVLKILDFARKKFKGKKGLVVINPFAAPSMSQEVLFANQLKYSVKSDVSAELARLNKELILSREVVDRLIQGKYGYIVFTAYPEALVNLTLQLSTLNADLPTVAGSAWGAVDSDVMRRYIANKKTAFYKAGVWVKGASHSINFEKMFFSKYGREPTPDNASGYDLGVIAGKTYELAKSKLPVLDKNLFYNSFVKIKCFDNLSIGKLCFKNSGGHSDAKVTFFRYTKKGFVTDN